MAETEEPVKWTVNDDNDEFECEVTNLTLTVGASVFGRVALDAVGVSRRLPVAEIGTVAAASDTAGDPRLLDGFTDHDAVLLELLGEDGVEERVAARVERQNEHGEHFGLLQRHELEPERRRQREEGDRSPAQEVGEHQQRHPLGDPRIVRIPRLRTSNRAVHLPIQNSIAASVTIKHHTITASPLRSIISNYAIITRCYIY